MFHPVNPWLKFFAHRRRCSSFRRGGSRSASGCSRGRIQPPGRGCGDRGDDRNAGSERFLHHLERDASAEQKHAATQRETLSSSAWPISLSSALCRPTSSRNVLQLRRSDRTARRHAARRFARKVSCFSRKCCGSSKQGLSASRTAVSTMGGNDLPDGLDRRFAADAAARRAEDIARQFGEIEGARDCAA